MSRISDAFKNGKAFIPFITAGDPDLETTKKLILEIQENGADIIELGIPFSDPIAEGEVIQEADIRALASGTRTDKIFDMLEKLKVNPKIPIAWDGYKAVYRYEDTEYNIEVIKSTKQQVLLDGKKQISNSIDLKNDKQTHTITVYINK